MSQEFNLRYDDIQPESNANDNTSLEQSECVTYYETEGHVRNVCFVSGNGDRIFLNYAYLTSGDFQYEQGQIFLCFTTHTVTIKGLNLSLLFDDLMKQTPKTLTAQGGRYSELLTSDRRQISQIDIVIIHS